MRSSIFACAAYRSFLSFSSTVSDLSLITFNESIGDKREMIPQCAPVHSHNKINAHDVNPCSFAFVFTPT